MRKALASLVILCASLIGASALAQSVQQSGSVTRGHLPAWAGSGVVQDAGTSANPQLNAVAAYGSGGCTISVTSTTTPGVPTGQYVQGCLSASNTGVQLSVTPFGGLGTQPFTVNVNGTLIPIGGPSWISANFDNQFCATQGAVIYRNSTSWVCLTPGSSGQVLQTQGPNANPAWVAGGGTGSVTSITAGTCLTGGTITSSGTIALNSPLTVACGGQGNASLTSHAVLIGNGTNPVNLAAPGVAGTCLQSNGAAADPTFQSCPGTGTVTSLTGGTGITLSPSTITSSGSITLASAPNAQLGGVQPPGGRLTLSTGVPVQTADVTAAATVYYDTYINNQVPIYSGTAWAYFTVTADEISIALDSNAGHTGYQANGSVFDFFIGNNSGITLCTGPAWTSTTARGSGASTTQLARLNGILTNAVSMTCRFGNAAGNTFTCGVNQCTYVGSMYATANGQTGFQQRAAGAAGGSNAVMALYNAYNRVLFSSRSEDSTSSWSYGTPTWRAADAAAAGGGLNNRVSWVDGLAQSPIIATYTTTVQPSSATGQIGVSLDWSSGAPTGVTGAVGSGSVATVAAVDNQPGQLGFHYEQGIEWSSAASTTFYGTGLPGGGGAAIVQIQLQM